MLNRRDFLALAALAPFATLLPKSLRTWTPTVEGDELLIALHLDGGADGLSFVAPIANDVYRRSRPTLALDPTRAIRIDDTWSFASSLRPLADLYHQGEVAVVFGVGTDSSDRSHFTNIERWHVGRNEVGDLRAPGWLAAALDKKANGQDSEAVWLGTTTMPRAIASPHVRSFGISSLDDLILPPELEASSSRRNGMASDTDSVSSTATAKSGGASTEGRSTSGVGRGAVADSSLRDAAVRSLDDARRRSVQLRHALQKDLPNGLKAPASRLGKDFDSLLRLVLSGHPARVFHATHGGSNLAGSYDTHNGQAGDLDALQRDLAECLAFLRQALHQADRWQRTTVLVFSEFGRRVAENGSRGTDHGRANVAFLLSGKLRGGLHGQPPSLDDLDDGDLRPTVDFRQLQATALRRTGLPSSIAPLDV